MPVTLSPQDPPDPEVFRSELMQSIQEYLAINQGAVRRDWNKAQLVAWISLVSSFVATIWTASGYLSEKQEAKIALALLVAVPAFMVAIESGFQYASRVKIHTSAIYTLSRYIMRLKRGDDPYKVADEFYSYMIDYGATFPSGSASPGLNIASTGGKGSGQ